jgi:hypothetical protein
MVQKSATFTTIFRAKKCYFHYDFACKTVPLSLRYAKKYYALYALPSTTTWTLLYTGCFLKNATSRSSVIYFTILISKKKKVVKKTLQNDIT